MSLRGSRSCAGSAPEFGGRPPVTVRLVDWADEEGARFGKSLFGSSACAGTLDMGEARALRDKDGIALPDALREVGVDFEGVKRSGRELAGRGRVPRAAHRAGTGAPRLGMPLGAVLGTFGVERHAVTFLGQARALGEHADEPAAGTRSSPRPG